VRLGPVAEPLGLGADRVRGDAIEPGDDVARLPADRAPAPQLAVVAHREQLGRVDHAADLAGLRGWRLGVVVVEAVDGIGERGGDEPAGSESLPGGAQERRAPLAPAEQLQRLHRHHDQRHGRPRRERAGVGRERLHR
jgi:hypothetical protein